MTTGTARVRVLGGPLAVALASATHTGTPAPLATVADADKAKAAIVKVVKAWCDWRDEAEGTVTEVLAAADHARL